MNGASWSQHKEGEMSSSRTKVTVNAFVRPLDEVLGDVTSIPAMWQCCWVSHHHRGKGREAPSTGAGSWSRRSKSVTVILVPTGESVMGGICRTLLPMCRTSQPGSGLSLTPTVMLAELEEVGTIPGHPGGSDSVPNCVCPVSNALL